MVGAYRLHTWNSQTRKNPFKIFSSIQFEKIVTINLLFLSIYSIQYK